MKVSVDELVDRVKANMEELTDSFDADIVVTAGIGVERYIREKMPDALLAVWATEPVSSLPLTDCASLLRPQRSSDGSGYVLLPDDVWRMAEFCMDGWRQPVTEFIDKRLPNMSCSSILYSGRLFDTRMCFIERRRTKTYRLLFASCTCRFSSGEVGSLCRLSCP